MAFIRTLCLLVTHGWRDGQTDRQTEALGWWFRTGTYQIQKSSNCSFS